MQIKGIMKVHHFARGIWEHEPTSLTLGCKRLRPLAPKLISSTTTAAAPRTTGGTCYDLKSFIRSPESSGPRKLESSDHQHKKESSQVEAAAAGGTRWNPTQEQIAILEMMYRGGMRTPNAQQIEQITVQLGKFGKIEGKNVFYWFQNHKARERQKQKRNSTTPDSPSSPFSTTLLSPPPVGGMEEELYDCAPYKRKCRSWGFDQCVEGDSRYSEEQVEEDRTLKLFPLHPEGIKFLN